MVEIYGNTLARRSTLSIAQGVSLSRPRQEAVTNGKGRVSGVVTPFFFPLSESGEATGLWVATAGIQECGLRSSSTPLFLFGV